jgi:hypothetical protein
MPHLASPRWDVWVVTNDGEALAGINVRLVYQNYSAEGRAHEVTLKTDEKGRVLFPAQYGHASLLQRLVYTLSSARGGGWRSGIDGVQNRSRQNDKLS